MVHGNRDHVVKLTGYGQQLITRHVQLEFVRSQSQVADCFLGVTDDFSVLANQGPRRFGVQKNHSHPVIHHQLKIVIRQCLGTIYGAVILFRTQIPGTTIHLGHPVGKSPSSLLICHQSQPVLHTRRQQLTRVRIEGVEQLSRNTLNSYRVLSVVRFKSHAEGINPTCSGRGAPIFDQ